MISAQLYFNWEREIYLTQYIHIRQENKIAIVTEEPDLYREEYWNRYQNRFP